MHHLGGGAEGIRTPDLRRAKAALSQLSYGPGTRQSVRFASPSFNARYKAGLAHALSGTREFRLGLRDLGLFHPLEEWFRVAGAIGVRQLLEVQTLKIGPP